MLQQRWKQPATIANAHELACSLARVIRKVKALMQRLKAEAAMRRCTLPS
jgi:hypothetical protein